MRSYARSTLLSRQERDRLIAEHADTARRIALRLGRRVPDWIGEDDLIATAMLGLAEAADRYDPTRGEPFLAFAERRIRGEILDELRRGDILPRRARAKARTIAEVTRKLEQKFGRSPEDDEMAAALNVTLQEYRQELEMLVHVSLVEWISDGEGGAAMDRNAPSPLEVVEKRKLLDQFRVAVNKLSERDALILSLYYNEELTYSEIGEVIGVSESRVCQLHSRALLRLRASMLPSEGQ